MLCHPEPHPEVSYALRIVKSQKNAQTRDPQEESHPRSYCSQRSAGKLLELQPDAASSSTRKMVCYGNGTPWVLPRGVPSEVSEGSLQISLCGRDSADLLHGLFRGLGERYPRLAD